MSILSKIVEQTKVDIQKRKFQYHVSDLKSMEDYQRERRSLKEVLKGKGVSIIAEIKKASPSKGLIRADFDPVLHASQYENAGAAALSVLTDKPFFRGDLLYMQLASRKVDIPVMRKDFIVDSFQIEEARAFGADAILLIATILEKEEIKELHEYATELGLASLVECYHESELEKLDFEQVEILGVNNRDLNTFDVDVHRGIQILKKAPENVITVSESGLSTYDDIVLLENSNIDAALIGETFMRKDDPGIALREITGNN